MARATSDRAVPASLHRTLGQLSGPSQPPFCSPLKPASHAPQCVPCHFLPVLVETSIEALPAGNTQYATGCAPIVTVRSLLNHYNKIMMEETLPLQSCTWHPGIYNDCKKKKKAMGIERTLPHPKLCPLWHIHLSPSTRYYTLHLLIEKTAHVFLRGLFFLCFAFFFIFVSSQPTCTQWMCTILLLWKNPASLYTFMPPPWILRCVDRRGWNEPSWDPVAHSKLTCLLYKLKLFLYFVVLSLPGLCLLSFSHLS